jgi:hypothetical protein
MSTKKKKQPKKPTDKPDLRRLAEELVNTENETRLMIVERIVEACDFVPNAAALDTMLEAIYAAASGESRLAIAEIVEDEHRTVCACCAKAVTK